MTYWFVSFHGNGRYGSTSFEVTGDIFNHKDAVEYIKINGGIRNPIILNFIQLTKSQYETFCN